MFCDIIAATGALHVGSLENCIAACVDTPECVDVSYKPGCDECWLKRKVNSGTYNTEVWGARLLGVGVGVGGGLSSSVSVSVSVEGKGSGSSGMSVGSKMTTTTRSKPSSGFGTATTTRSVM